MLDASNFSNSHQNSTSGNSSTSFFSNIIKKSRHSHKKTKKKCQVKEEFPSEEDNLIGMLKEEVRITQTDKEKVKDRKYSCAL